MERYKINQNGNYIIIADIHGNYIALEAIIEEALKKYGKRLTGFIFLGDYICDFPKGRKVIEIMQKLNEKYEFYAITGNRETGMLKKFYEATKDHYKNGVISIEEASRLTGWSLSTSMGAPLIDCCRLTKEQIEFVLAMPESMVLDNGRQTFLLKHKTPLSKEEVTFLENESKLVTDIGQKRDAILLTAHNHEQSIHQYGDIIYCNPGSSGLPDIGNPGAYYGELNKVRLISERIDYDYERAIKELEEDKILFERCDNWGEYLKLSIQTGLNVAVLYANERNRLIAIFKSLPEETVKRLLMRDITLDEIKSLLPMIDKNGKRFGINAYGNTNPYGGHLEKELYVGSDSGISIDRKKVYSNDVEEPPKKEEKNNLDPPKELISKLAKIYVYEYLKAEEPLGYHMISDRTK